MKKRDWQIATISVGSTLGAFFVVALILHLFSFEIVYDSEVITNWDAVSGVAAWVSILVSVAAVIASIVAIVYAIRIPKEIADRQDRIALFEKRFACYMAVQDILMYADAIEKTDDLKLIQAYYILVTKYKRRQSDEVTLVTVSSDMGNIEQTILSGGFLFKQFDVELMQKAMAKIGPVLTSIFPASSNQGERLPEDKNVLKNEFCDICREFKEKYLDLIEKEMNIINT